MIIGAQAAAAAGPLGVKQVAAPPENIAAGFVTLPEPDQLGVRSTTALLPIRPDARDPARAEPIRFTAGDRRPAAVVVISDDAWTARLDDASGRPLFAGTHDPAADARAGAAPDAHRVDADLPALLGGVAATRLDLGRIAGGHTLDLSAARGFVLIDPGADVSLYTHPTTLERVAGRPFGLRPWLDNARVTRAKADVTDPKGTLRTVAADADGVIRFTPDAPGPHAVRVEVAGVNDAGNAVVLTTQHLVHVSRAAPFVDASQIAADGVLTVTLPSPAGVTPPRSITAAEVWGLRAGAMVPVCWVAQLAEAERQLAIDLRWVARSGVDPATLELRNLRSHDVESYSLIGFRPRLALAPVDAAAIPEPPAAITDDMRTGRPGAATVASSIPDQPAPRTAGPGHRLFLVHGYCSDGNPFPPSHFTGAVAAFADPDQNRSHDQFAQTLLTQGAPMKSYGIVGHSQGGNAALHLSTFYWSGLDWAAGERPIQGVGVPFQGTPLAGDAAVLGAIFGTGCGSNADLDPAGAASWLSLIPASERAKVWYWTTAFEDRPFALDYCNFVSGLLLSDPEDGVVERSRAQLPGANNMGHTEGWCHTTGMRDPAQTTDAARNAEMNQRAAR
jgi:hypothetical protein